MEPEVLSEVTINFPKTKPIPAPPPPPAPVYIKRKQEQQEPVVVDTPVEAVEAVETVKVVDKESSRSWWMLLGGVVLAIALTGSGSRPKHGGIIYRNTNSSWRR